MARSQDSAAGMDLVRRLLTHMVENDEAGAMAEVNGASEVEVRWALAHLASLVREQAQVLARHSKPRRTWQNLLRASVKGIEQDIVETSVAALAQEASESVIVDG